MSVIRCLALAVVWSTYIIGAASQALPPLPAGLTWPFVLYALDEGFGIAGIESLKEDYLISQSTNPSSFQSAHGFEVRKPFRCTLDSARCRSNGFLEAAKIINDFLNYPSDILEILGDIPLQDYPGNIPCKKNTNCDPNCFAPANCHPIFDRDYRRPSGVCNNWNEPLWGSSFVPFIRMLEPAYEDRLNEAQKTASNGDPLPSARRVSLEASLHLSDSFHLEVTDMYTLFGQFIDHDIDFTPVTAGKDSNGDPTPILCCENDIATSDELSQSSCFPIDTNGDPFYFDTHNVKCLKFVRSLHSNGGCQFGPRNQENQVTSFIDGSAVYGSTAKAQLNLRTLEDGQLKDFNIGEFDEFTTVSCPNVCPYAYLPPSPDNPNNFLAGDGRVNENSNLVAVHTLLLRMHNDIARTLKVHNPSWSIGNSQQLDQKLFQEACRIVGAILQSIVYNEYLPVTLGDYFMNEYNLWYHTYPGYDSSVNPTIYNEFATAAFRFGHSMVPSDMFSENIFWRPLKDDPKQPRTIDLFTPIAFPTKLIKGTTSHPSAKMDSAFIKDLHELLFAGPGFPYGGDLAALNIQRGRDHGLPKYNEWRYKFTGAKFDNFNEMIGTMTPAQVAQFDILYNSVDDMDLYIAAIAEDPCPNCGIMGETFTTIIAIQFEALMKGDRFFYLNKLNDYPFTDDQIAALIDCPLSAIICKYTTTASMQPEAFKHIDSTTNPVESCADILANTALDTLVEDFFSEL